MAKNDVNILEWNKANPKDEVIAKRISKKIQLGNLYFTYNVPLQIWISYNKEDDPKSGISMAKSQILNYMPRKETCVMENLEDVFKSNISITAKDIKDFMKVSAAIFKNLARLMENINPLNANGNNCIYYPNSNG